VRVASQAVERLRQDSGTRPERGIADYPTYAMPSKGIAPVSTVSPNWPIFQIHKPDTVDFASLAGLTKMTGEPAHRLSQPAELPNLG
jgi:hypothetical protein